MSYQTKRLGATSIIFEIIKDILKEIDPPIPIIIRWISHALYIKEQMKKKERIAIEFAEYLSKRDIQTTVLNGLAFASYYPDPYHRES